MTSGSGEHDDLAHATALALHVHHSTPPMEGKTYTSGVGFTGLLTLIFITLKLVGEHFHTPVADWAWLWVLSPLWIPLAIFLAVALVGLVVLAVMFLVALAAERRR